MRIHWLSRGFTNFLDFPFWHIIERLSYNPEIPWANKTKASGSPWLRLIISSLPLVCWQLQKPLVCEATTGRTWRQRRGEGGDPSSENSASWRHTDCSLICQAVYTNTGINVRCCCEENTVYLPWQMNVCFLHDGEPGQERLQVVLTGQVVIQSLRGWELTISFHTQFCIMTLANFFFVHSLTVMICALSSGERVEAFGFPLNSRWKACMALAVTSYSRKHSSIKNYT